MNDSEKKQLIETWKLFEQAAHGEKSWMNDRISWLLIPQGVLFATLAWLMKKDPNCSTSDIENELVILVPLLGGLLSVAGFIGVLAAGCMHFIWTTKLNKIAKELNTGGEEIVPFGSKPHWPARSSSVIPSFIALMFTGVWIWLFLVLDTLNTKTIMLIGISFVILLIVFISVITCYGNYLLKKK